MITLEKALHQLDSFIQESDLTTKTNHNKKRIASIDTLYRSDEVYTRAGAPLPNAYLVNYENNEGYAVLGANSNVEPIIAVTEKGNLTPEQLNSCMSSSGPVTDRDDNPIENPDSTIIYIPGSGGTTNPNDRYEVMPADLSWYCAAEDDYYTAQPNEDFPHQCLNVALGAKGQTFPVRYRYICYDPLLTTKWGQGEYDDISGLYNRFCYKGKGNRRKIVFTGCSTTALASIIAYNEFPQNLNVNNVLLKYAGMKQYPTIDRLDLDGQYHLELLMGSIFHNVYHWFATPDGTLITPRQIQLWMQKLGYSNVVRLKGNNMTESMSNEIIDMLAHDKPVFISAIRGLVGGHSWVIDGAKVYEDLDLGRNSCMFHCDWGNDGANNGYYSSACFKPNPEGREYSWHFRVITYDVPVEDHTRTINFNY